MKAKEIDKQSVTLDGWVARNMSGGVYLHRDKPRAQRDFWLSNHLSMDLPTDFFPDLKWEDEPKLVTIQITEK